MGQQISTLGEGAASSPNAAAERKIRAENGEVGHGHPSPAWRNSVSSVMSSIPGHGELTTGENSVHKPRIETEVCRMSIRAAIDTFIENCLSTPADEKVPDKPQLSSPVSSMGDENKRVQDSSTSRNSNSCAEDSDGSHSDAAGSDNTFRGQVKNVNNEEHDAEAKELIIDCDEKATVEDEGENEKGDPKGIITYDCDSSNSCPVIQKVEVNKEYKDGKVNKIKEESVKDSPTETVSGTVEKQLKPSVSSEKQSFSAFLQDRLKRIDYDKHEELAQLALSTDIQCQGQMIMWEVAKKPVVSNTSSGPVRLQTLIDKVLDNSLNNQGPPPTTGCSISSRSSDFKQDATPTQSSPSDDNIKEQQWNSNAEKSTPAPKENKLCFKDHIEKVLLESFLSYEEDERKEALKNEGKSNSPCTEIPTDRQKGTKEGTISVQDIVDQVISQTEMISKLLTPSARDVSKSTSYAGQLENAVISSGTSPQSNSGLKYQNISPQSRALLEAQRHTVQKEHQSSTTLGRKRGRPQLHTLSSSNNSTPEPVKDLKSTHYDDRVQDVKSGHMPTRMHGHIHSGPPPLSYASQGSLQYNIPASINSMMSSQSTALSSTIMLQHRQHITQRSAESPSSVRASMLPTSSGYQAHPHDNFHQQRDNQHLSNHVRHQPHRSQPHYGSHISNSNAPPPPLILADRVKENMSSVTQGRQFMPVAHIPTRSCSCNGCLTHFSRALPHSTNTQQQQHTHHQFTEQDRVGDPAIHSSNYNTYPVSSSHMNPIVMSPQPVSTISETLIPVLAIASQDVPPTYVVSQKHKWDQGSIPVTREVTSGRHVGLESSSGLYQYSQDKIPGVIKAAVLDPRFPDPHGQVSRQRVQLTYPVSEGDAFKKLPRDSSPYTRTVEDSKVRGSTLVTQAGQDVVQPLDLSVKPSPNHRQETRSSGHGNDLSRQDMCERMSPYRRTFTNQRNKGQYVENERLSASGQHLQILENTVDKLFLHGQPQSQIHVPVYTQHTHIPLQGLKMSSHPTPCDPRPDCRGQSDHAHLASQPRIQESQDPRNSLHSPIVYTQVIADSPPLQQQPQHPRNLTSSPGVGPYQNRSPGVGHGPDTLNNSDLPSPYQISESQSFPVRVLSPSGYQRPPSLGMDQKSRSATPGLSPACVSTPSHPQSSPSPEDQDSQKFSVSRHEPIQNIIGNHPPSDILYLICRLCRQTYGSPYGFRKHFRNQHGFEPKADHTIVQTISATKTAMAHTGPLDVTEEPQPIKDEKPHFDDIYTHSQSYKSHPEDSITTPTSQSLSNPTPQEDMKSDINKEVSENTKCLECPECGQTFQLNDFGSYKRHCRQHNLHRSSGPFACHDCHRSFADQEKLRDHLVTHSSFTPSLCGICQTFFSSPSYLAEHLQAAHGHAYINEERERSSHSDRAECNTSAAIIRESEHSQPHGIQSNSDQISRSNSFKSQSAPITTSSYDAAASASVHSSAPSGLQQMLMRSLALPSSVSSVNHKQPLSVHHHVSRLVPGDSHMFTVHTPKGLEVEKLPADGVVTTASPDSSYDEAKNQLDLLPGSSVTQRVTRSTDTGMLGGSEMSRSSKFEQESNSSGYDSRTSAVVFILPKKEEASNHTIKSRDEAESKSSESQASIDSNGLSVKLSSSLEVEEADTFYKHKKYGRYRKRPSSCDVGSESETKSPKVEAGNQAHRRSPYSVSSTVNSGVTVQDCESSCSNMEESSLNSNKPPREDGNSNDATLPQKLIGVSKDKVENNQVLTSETGTSKHGASIADGATELTWDRQTRSQAGKTSQVTIYTS